MKSKLLKIILINFVFLISLNFPPDLAGNQILAQEIVSEKLGIPTEPQIPGRVEATGVEFRIENSEYLNITFKSSQEIKVVLESIPRMISMDIDASFATNSTILTLSGLEPNKTYYKYH